MAAADDSGSSAAGGGVVRRAGRGVVRAASGAVSGTKAFALGTRCLVRGVGRMVSTPWLWPYALAPIAVAMVVFLGVAWWLVEWLAPAAQALAAEYLGQTGGVAAWIVTAALLVAAAVLAFYVAFPAVVRVVAAPFLALLSDRVFKDVSGLEPPTPPGSRFMRWIVRPIVESLVLVLIRLVVTLVALPLVCVPGAGAALFFTLLLPIEGMDLLDLALSARAVPFGERLRFVRRNTAASAGLGLGSAGVLLVPVVNVLFLPALVVGAALLDRELSADYPVAPQGGVL